MIESASEESDTLWCLSQESFPFQNSVKESQVFHKTTVKCTSNVWFGLFPSIIIRNFY